MYPTLFRFGHVAIPTYGVLAACGLICGLTLSLRTARLAGLSPEAIWDAGLFCALAAFTLSRLWLVANHFRSFLVHPFMVLASPSLTVTAMVGTALLTTIWLVRHRLPMLATMDAWSPCATMVLAFLSLGHLAEGSDPGLRGGSVGGVGAVVGVGLTALLLFMLRRGRVGQTTAAGLIGTGATQFALGFLRVPDTSGVTTLLDPLQWLAVGSMLAGCVLLVAVSWEGITPRPTQQMEQDAASEPRALPNAEDVARGIPHAGFAGGKRS